MNLFSFWHAGITTKSIFIRNTPPDQRRHTTAGFAFGGSAVAGVGVEIGYLLLMSFEFTSGSTR
jgi:hypothetical protein